MSKRLGAIAIVVILAVTAGAIGLNSDIVKNRYPITATFADTAGMQSGDSVLLAGVVVGQVNGVKLSGNKANVAMQISATLSVDERSVSRAERALPRTPSRRSASCSRTRTAVRRSRARSSPAPARPRARSAMTSSSSPLTAQRQ